MIRKKINACDRQDDVGEEMAIEPLLTIPETAEILKISVRETWREVARGNLEVVRMGPKKVRVTPRTLRRYITKRQS